MISHIEHAGRGWWLRTPLFLVYFGIFVLTVIFVYLIRLHDFTIGQVLAQSFPCFSILYIALFLLLRKRTAIISTRGIFLTSILLVLPWFCIPPIGSTDAYSYGYFGRLQTAHHENPYTINAETRVDDPFFVQTLSDKSFQSPYGPLATGFTALVAAISGDRVPIAVLIFRLVAVAGFAVLLVTALRLGFSRNVVLLIAWNPYIVFETANNAHFDIWLAFILMLAINLWQQKRYMSGVGLLTIGALLKFISLVVLIPFVFRVFREIPYRKALTVAVAACIIPILSLSAGFLYYWEGPKTIATVVNLAGTFLLPFYHPVQWLAWLIQIVLPVAQAENIAHLIGIAFAVFTIGIVSVRAKTIQSTAVITLLAIIFLALSYMQPWYLLWVIPLLLAHTNARFQQLGVLLTVLGLVLYPWY